MTNEERVYFPMPLFSYFQRDGDGTLALDAVRANSLGYRVLAALTPQRNFCITYHSVHVNTYEFHAVLLQHVVHELLDTAFIDTCRLMA